MASKTDFNHDEWRILRDSMTLVTVAVSSAEASGLFGTLKEALAPAELIREAIMGENELIRSLCERSEMRQSAEDLRKEIPNFDFNAFKDRSIREAKQHCQTGKAILLRKSFTDDAEAYSRFIMALAIQVAKAAREDSLTGYQADSISDNERLLLHDLATLLEQPTDGLLEA